MTVNSLSLSVCTHSTVRAVLLYIQAIKYWIYHCTLLLTVPIVVTATKYVLQGVPRRCSKVDNCLTAAFIFSYPLHLPNKNAMAAVSKLNINSLNLHENIFIEGKLKILNLLSISFKGNGRILILALNLLISDNQISNSNVTFLNNNETDLTSFFETKWAREREQPQFSNFISDDY